MKKKGLEEVFYFLPETKSPLTIMHLFDVFLLTSKREGLPNVLMEAQSVGVPVVAPNVGGCSEAFIEEETGFLVRDRRVSSFSSALSKIIQNTKLREDVRTAGPKWIEKQFSVQKMVDAMFRTYGMERRE